MDISYPLPTSIYITTDYSCGSSAYSLVTIQIVISISTMY